MGNAILDYLAGAIELDALSDAEKCAVCAAMEGEWVGHPIMLSAIGCWEYVRLSVTDKGARIYSQPTDYLSDGTAALRLVERFGLVHGRMRSEWYCAGNIGGTYIGHIDHDGVTWLRISNDDGSWYKPDFWAHADTPAAAIVSAVCALAREQYPYKVETLTGGTK